MALPRGNADARRHRADQSGSWGLAPSVEQSKGVRLRSAPCLFCSVQRGRRHRIVDDRRDFRRYKTRGRYRQPFTVGSPVLFHRLDSNSTHAGWLDVVLSGLDERCRERTPETRHVLPQVHPVLPNGCSARTNPNADYHFFTVSQAEFDAAVRAGYRDEATGQSGFAVLTEPTVNATPIYRLYNLATGATTTRSTRPNGTHWSISSRPRCSELILGLSAGATKKRRGSSFPRNSRGRPRFFACTTTTPEYTFTRMTRPSGTPCWPSPAREAPPHHTLGCCIQALVLRQRYLLPSTIQCGSGAPRSSNGCRFIPVVPQRTKLERKCSGWRVQADRGPGDES